MTGFRFVLNRLFRFSLVYIAPSQKDNRMEFINWYLEMRLNDE